MFGLFRKPPSVEQLEFALVTTTGIHLKTYGRIPSAEEVLHNVNKVINGIDCKLTKELIEVIKFAGSVIVLSYDLKDEFKSMVAAGPRTDGKIYADIVKTLRRRGVGI